MTYSNNFVIYRKKYKIEIIHFVINKLSLFFENNSVKKIMTYAKACAQIEQNMTINNEKLVVLKNGNN